MFEVLDKTKEWILDILLPRFCIGCGREGLYICKDCEVFLSEMPPSPEVMSAWEYEGLMEKLIQKIKFDGCYHIIDELVDKALAKINLNLLGDTVITYVPMHKKRERQRGFNQSKLIAYKLGVVLNRVKYKPLEVVSLLKKERDNRSQVGLGPKEREDNVRGVFGLQESFVPKNVLLVDDIYTTGATINECKKVLRKAGVKNVWAFTLARKLRI